MGRAMGFQLSVTEASVRRFFCVPARVPALLHYSSVLHY